MRALIFVEHSEGAVVDSAFEMAALAKSIGVECHGLICAGDDETAKCLVEQLAGYDDATIVTDKAIEDYNPEAALTVLRAAIEDQNPDLVVLSYSTAGLDLASSVSILADRPMVGYVSDLEGDDSDLKATSQVYGGKLLAMTDLPLPSVITVMPGARKADDLSGDAPASTAMSVDLSNIRTRVKDIISPDTSGVNLADAEKIVCVGRAIGGTDKLPLAEGLATSLGAEVAGSRPVIDAGWLPKIRQVGKSGNKVKPKLYLMAGVSGAPEHLEGMESSELIIAINSDEQAPIFNKAHYGAVCDMFQLLPLLSERIQGNT